MKYSIIALTAFAAVVAAENCKPGLYYCAKSLMNRGRYAEQINEAVQKLVAANPGNPDAEAIRNNADVALFKCEGGRRGEISIVKKCCNYCVDGGSNRNDWCNEGIEPIGSKLNFPPFPYGALNYKRSVEVPFKA